MHPGVVESEPLQFIEPLVAKRSGQLETTPGAEVNLDEGSAAVLYAQAVFPETGFEHYERVRTLAGLMLIAGRRNVRAHRIATMLAHGRSNEAVQKPQFQPPAGAGLR